MTNLNPTCTVTPSATVVPASGSTHDFTRPVQYTVTAQDGLHSTVYTVTVTVTPPPLSYTFDNGAGQADWQGWTVISQNSGSPKILVSNTTERGYMLNHPCITTRSGTDGGTFSGDASHTALIARSPTFQITGSPITIESAGGNLSSLAPNLGTGSYNTQVMGVALVRTSDGYRVASVRTGSQDVAPTMRSNTLNTAAYVNDGITYYLEAVDTYSGGWGYIEWDTFSIPGHLSLSGCDLLTFGWGGYTANIVGTNVSLTVPYGTDLTTLNPTFTVSPFATVSPASGTARNFTTPQTYTVTAQDGVTTKIYTATVYQTTVPGTIITVPPGLNPGDQYRLVFVTSGTTYGNVRDNAALTSIGYFNTFGANAAAAVPTLNALATTWKAVVSTNSTANVQTDAKANTLTRTADPDAPIYNLDGLRVASGNASLWANTLEHPINVTELGGGPPADPRVHTGTLSGGTGWYTDGCLANPNGTYVGWGYANSTTVTWVYENRGPDVLRPIYVMSGVLTVPTPANTYVAWAAANGASTDPAADSNHNGIPNGVEHFMGATAAKSATMPAVVNTNGVLTWTWPYDPTAAVTYKFQLSDTMSAWTDVAPGDSRVSVLANPSRTCITLPAGAARKFCRLVVTPNWPPL